MGTVAGIEQLGDSIRLRVNATKVVSDVQAGDSICVSGVCLTVIEFDDAGFVADVMQESLDRSALGELVVGAPVNLERAMPVTGRLGGHIMQGHVDGVTTLLSREHSEHWDVLRFKLPSELARYVVEKGSIAISGTSLTVSAIGEDWFEVSLIPTTLAETILGGLTVGATVNVEVDVVAKYVEKMLANNS